MAGGEVIGNLAGSERRYFLKDHLGSVRTTVDRNGNVVGYDDYYPFGLTMPWRSSNSSNPNDDYKFTGYEKDDEARLTVYHANARMYDPVLGRFLQIDPLHMERPGLSTYNYVQNNPLNRVDPMGLLDVYYDEYGNYLGEDELETDYIWITSKENFEANLAKGEVAIQANSIAITDAKLSLEGWSNLFTDVFEKAGYSTDYLHNGMISVANFENRDAGMGMDWEYMVGSFNDAQNGRGIINAWMTGSQHALLTLNTFYGKIDKQLGTVANIQNTYVHELVHYVDFRNAGQTFKVGARGELKAYLTQMKHSTFLRTTLGYQYYIGNNCRKHGGCK